MKSNHSEKEFNTMNHENEEQTYNRCYTKSIIIIITAIAMIIHNTSKSSISMLKGTKRILSVNTDSKTCVKNIHVDRFPMDELVPVGHDETSRQIITGTLMSEYEGEIIKRFLTSVAGVFRPKKYTQHLIFSGLKNGGYLANIASLLWPIKKHGLQEKVTLHLIDDSDDEHAETFNDIVDNLSLKEKVDKVVHIHDLTAINRASDETNQKIQSEMPSESWFSFAKHAPKLRKTQQTDIMDISSLIQSSSESNEDVIPYFHVGGQYMRNQVDLLNGAIPFFRNQSIATVGVEHSRDMDVDTLLQFFNSMKYKTYLLGKNHLVRIDNLCQSVLHGILERPEFKIPLPKSDQMKNGGYGFHTAPAFYVALAGSRFESEVRSIQHTYDMLGVYSLQPSNAQDRSRERHSSMFASLIGLSEKDNSILERQRIYTESE